ncbi:hypothetical protein RJ641_009964 [Dillenia turbinata]|uniref:Uncharacterized protein n=1 Tax=Dillenia turbinata TaxID=194707 RepID=A0AAN8V2N3_9MAGN
MSKQSHTISVLPGEGDTKQQCEAPLAFLSLLGVPRAFEDQICLDAQWDCQKCINVAFETADCASPTVHVDVEKGNSEAPGTGDATFGNSKTESALAHLQKALQQQINLDIGSKLMQILMNNANVFLRFTSRDRSAIERVHDTPCRGRKLKRTASFDSRRVVLLFSVL